MVSEMRRRYYDEGIKLTETIDWWFVDGRLAAVCVVGVVIG